MIDSLVAGKGRYEGIMADHEVERFRIWEEMGNEMVVSGVLPLLHELGYMAMLACLISLLMTKARELYGN
jgi:hypothetical protein